MFRSKNRSRKESREVLMAALPTNENGDVPEDFLRRRNNLRSRRSIIADGRSTAKKVYPRNMPPEQAVAWVMNPGRYDVEGIDTKAPANVRRREPKTAKPKAPAGKKTKPKTPKTKAPDKPKAPEKPTDPKKPATPKKPKAPAEPKAPKKPKAPAPVRDPGVVVPGSEIAAIADLFTAAECLPISLESGQCSVDWNGNYGIAMDRADGRGLFGLDNEAVRGLLAYNSGEMSELDRDTLYRVSVEDERVVFRWGDNPSDVDLKAATIRIDGKFTPEHMYSGFEFPPMFYMDVAEFRNILDRMKSARIAQCRLESTKGGITVTSAGGGPVIRGVIGPPMKGKARWSSYDVNDLHTLMMGLTPYVYSAGFCLDGPMILKGRLDDYEITAVIRSSWRPGDDR